VTRIKQRGAVAFTAMGVAVVVILLITLWGWFRQKENPAVTIPWGLNTWVSAGQGSDTRRFGGRWLTLPFSAAPCTPRCTDTHTR
jgi:urea transporter